MSSQRIVYDYVSIKYILLEIGMAEDVDLRLGVGGLGIHRHAPYLRVTYLSPQRGLKKNTSNHPAMPTHTRPFLWEVS